MQSGETTISEEADSLFTGYDKGYYWRCRPEGLIPTLILRIQDYIWKLVLLYPAMNRSETIKVEHLTSAIAIGNYLEASVTEVFRSFSETKGKQWETKVLEYLGRKAGPVDYTTAYRELGMSATQSDQCAESLGKFGSIQNTYSEGKVGETFGYCRHYEKCTDLLTLPTL